MVKGHRGFTLCTKRQHLSNIPESYLYLHNQVYRERKTPSSNASTHPGSGCGGSSLSSPDLPFPSHLPQLIREGETAEAFPGQSVSRVYLEPSSLCYVPGTPRQLVVLLRLSALSKTEATGECRDADRPVKSTALLLHSAFFTTADQYNAHIADAAPVCPIRFLEKKRSEIF